MKTKPSTHGSPWTRIDGVERELTALVDECSTYTSESISDLTSHMQALDARIVKLEEPSKSVTRRKKVQKKEGITS